jgi:Phytanoyl-CoA dioxygenase (PhyH)
MELTQEQKQALYEQGFVKLSGILSQELIHKALYAINASLGSEGIDPAQLPRFRAQSFCPEVQKTPAITDLLTASPLWSLAESAIGKEALQPVTSGQIALRFPGPGPANVGRPHIDGMHTPTNGVPAGQIYSFTALIGVYLSDIPHEFMGNLSIWPGTHHRYEQYFREQGPQSLLNGMPSIAMPDPIQLTGQAGDAIIAHYELAHGIAANVSPFTRYAIYFRLIHKNHEHWKWESMTNIWLEWAGMQEFVGH